MRLDIGTEEQVVASRKLHEACATSATRWKLDTTSRTYWPSRKSDSFRGQTTLLDAAMTDKWEY